MYEYLPAEDLWKKVTTYPGNIYSERANALSVFTIGSKIYTKIQSECYEYNLNSDIWTRKNDFPGNHGRYIFSFRGKGYLVSGFNLWMYDPQTDVWKKTDSSFKEYEDWMPSKGITIGDYVYMSSHTYNMDSKNTTLSPKNEKIFQLLKESPHLGGVTFMKL